MEERIYFDYAATAPLRPQARVAMAEALEMFGNPSSIHAEGQRARAITDDARRVIGGALGVRAERIVMTSGGTEAANLALRGVAGGNRQWAMGNGKKVLVSAIEHDCVLETGRVLGAEETPVTADGVVDLAWLKERLSKGDVGLVSVMHANNETGVVQPVRDIAGLAHAYGALFHTDAVQTVGHLPVNVDEMGADLLSFSAHKFGGPKGVGGLVVRPEIRMEAILTGGGQERNRRGGTENVAGIAGMAAALEAALRGMDAECVTAREIGRVLEKGLPEGCVVVGKGEKVPHVLQMILPGKASGEAVIGMDMRGVAVSQGSACSSGKVKSSPVLTAMGFTEEEAGRGLRLSWGWGSSVGEAQGVLAALRDIVK